MKRAFFIFSICLTLTQCTENETERIIFPELTSLSASIIGKVNRYNLVEFTGQFTEGHVPLEDIKFGWRENANTSDPKLFWFDKSVERLNANTFKVQMQVDPADPYAIAFNFVSEGMATFSESYTLTVANDQAKLVRSYP